MFIEDILLFCARVAQWKYEADVLVYAPGNVIVFRISKECFGIKGCSEECFPVRCLWPAWQQGRAHNTTWPLNIRTVYNIRRCVGSPNVIWCLIRKNEWLQSPYSCQLRYIVVLHVLALDVASCHWWKVLLFECLAVVRSASFLAEISVTSPRKLFIFIIWKNIFWMKVSKKYLF